jgi:hypothetical protein
VLFPFLKQLPPRVDPISDHSEQPRRDSGFSLYSVTSESNTSDESLESPSSTLDSEAKDNSDKRATVLLASQARARAARPSTFALSSSLWTLKESPSPMPSQLGKEHEATNLSDAPDDVLCDSPSSIQYSTSPPEEHKPEMSRAALKRTRSNHCLSLLHRKGSHHLSLPGLSRRKSPSSPHLREAAAAHSRKGSTSGDRNHRHTSVSGHSASSF